MSALDSMSIGYLHYGQRNMPNWGRDQNDAIDPPLERTRELMRENLKHERRDQRPHGEHPTLGLCDCDDCQAYDNDQNR